MITKERLEELIGQGASVWESSLMEEIILKDCHIYRDMNNDYRLSVSDEFGVYIIVYLEDLFETKEEAEWYLEFGNIHRTETLSLPSWEEFVKIEENSDYGFTDIKRFDNVRFGYKYCPEKQTSALFVDNNGETLFYTLMVTKENYTEACRLAKKLFLGEKSE